MPKRIGVTGRSGGGATSWWVAAADDRPRCIIPVAGITDLHSHVLEGVAPRLQRRRHLRPLRLHVFREHLSLGLRPRDGPVRPRPLLLGNSDADDIFPVAGYRRLADKAQRIYELYGAADRFQLLETKGPHKDTPELRVGAFRWMNRWLKNERGEVRDDEVAKLTPRQLKVFDRLPADAINATIHESFLKAAKIELPQAPAVVARVVEGLRSRVARGTKQACVSQLAG